MAVQASLPVSVWPLVIEEVTVQLPPGAVMVAVWMEVAGAEPEVFAAVTVARMVLPSSAVWRV